MSYKQLAKKYGISKSCVADLVKGRRRGQAKVFVQKAQTRRERPQKVRVSLRIALRSRALLHRLGGGTWIDNVAARIDDELRRARLDDPNLVLERVIAKLGAVK